MSRPIGLPGFKPVKRDKIPVSLPTSPKVGMLASSGQVDMYTLQKLLTHKSPLMTQRYAHLRDETLRNASNLAGDIITEAAKGKEDSKVVNSEEKKE